VQYDDVTLLSDDASSTLCCDWLRNTSHHTASFVLSHTASFVLSNYVFHQAITVSWPTVLNTVEILITRMYGTSVKEKRPGVIILCPRLQRRLDPIKDGRFID
jgi:hypothetical protein